MGNEENVRTMAKLAVIAQPPTQQFPTRMTYRVYLLSTMNFRKDFQNCVRRHVRKTPRIIESALAQCMRILVLTKMPYNSIVV